MNIFVLDTDPTIAAQMQCDKHVVKMPLECAQMLSTVHRHYGSDDFQLYKSTHKHHPCTLWAASSRANYAWLFDHFRALNDEYFRLCPTSTSVTTLSLLTAPTTEMRRLNYSRIQSVNNQNGYTVDSLCVYM